MTNQKSHPWRKGLLTFVETNRNEDDEEDSLNYKDTIFHIGKRVVSSLSDLISVSASAKFPWLLTRKNGLSLT